MGPPQGLHNVIEAVKLLTDIPQIQFVPIGEALFYRVIDSFKNNNHSLSSNSAEQKHTNRSLS